MHQSYPVLNALFKQSVNTPFNNILFNSPTIPGMHAAMTRLYTAASQLKGVEGQSAVARLLGESPQTVNNWERRGISQAGALKAQQLIGCDAVWLLSGAGQMAMEQAGAPSVPPPEKEQSESIRRGLGMRLGSARQDKGLTQEQVAHRFSVNKATVSAWETGRGVPDALTLRDLAKFYDVSADSLLWEDSLTPDAMKVAAQFDGLTERQKRTFYAMWMAYVQESATDAQVEDGMPVTKNPQFVYDKRNQDPPLVQGQAYSGPERRKVGRSEIIGNIGPYPGEKKRVGNKN